MTATNFDVIINGTKAKLKRNVEGAYRRRYVRREIQQQVLSQSENPALSSRDDLARMMQTSWAGGATWWKPILGPSNIDSYFQSNHMDVWSEPGKVVPMNKVVDAATSGLHQAAVVAYGNGTLYAMGNTVLEDSTNKDIYEWTPASDAFTRTTGVTAGNGNPRSMVFDPSDNYMYVLESSGDIARFNPGTGAEDPNWIATGINEVTFGGNIFIQQGSIIVYDAEKLYKIDKATPAFTQIADDGLGTDVIENANTPATPIFHAAAVRLAVASESGVYYVKNIMQGGQPTPYVFRVEKDAAGNWIVNPIATLPPGTLALGITSHLGSIIVSTTSEWSAALENDDDNFFEITLFSVTQNGLNVLGSILGDRGGVDESPFYFLGSRGPILYVGGHKRLWVYDGIRGGLHGAWEWGTVSTNGPWSVMASVQDSSGNDLKIFLTKDRINKIKTDRVDDPDTVTNFGDDETHYTLESNYFDFNLPFETKEVTKVSIALDPVDGDQEWTVQLSADDGAFADALTHSTGSNPPVVESTLSTPLSGYVFRYKLIYQTKDTERFPLRGVLVSAHGGANVLEYELVLDGDELLNVDNEVQDEQAFSDALVTIADTETQITFSDNMQEQAQETDSATTIQVKVRAVEIKKSKPGESSITVVLREV